MDSHTDVATANIHWKLGDDQASAALRGILDLGPDLVGLQEWGLSRRSLLAATGPTYTWVSPVLGGCPVGVRSERFRVLGWRLRLLSGPGRKDRGATGRPTLTRPRLATVVTLHDQELDRAVSVIDFHLTPGVQRAGAYRDDRPVVVARHRREVRRLARLVGERLALGHVVLATGDSNVDGLRLPGLVSAWQGRDDSPGTLGPTRKVDDVHGPGEATEVRLLSNDSDHRALVVRRPDTSPAPPPTPSPAPTG